VSSMFGETELRQTPPSANKMIGKEERVPFRVKLRRSQRAMNLKHRKRVIESFARSVYSLKLLRPRPVLHLK